MPDDGPASGHGLQAGLIAHYEAIAQASHAMLAAARADDWVRVAQIEDDCRALTARLQAAGARPALSKAQQRRRVQLLRAILAADAEVRARSEPWLRELELMVGTPPARDSG